MTEIEYFLGYRTKGDLTHACFRIVKKCVCKRLVDNLCMVSSIRLEYNIHIQTTVRDIQVKHLTQIKIIQNVTKIL